MTRSASKKTQRSREISIIKGISKLHAGAFTAAQLASAGISLSAFHYHLKIGAIEKISAFTFRLNEALRSTLESADD